MPRAFREDLPPLRRAAVLSWLAFTATFGTVRAVTCSIRNGRGPFRDVTPGGVHLHHHLWGIALLSGIGGVAVRGEDRTRRHPLVALGHGTGMALVVDEFALLLDLRDVYWQRQGRVSVDVGIGSSRWAARPCRPGRRCVGCCAHAHARARAAPTGRRHR